MFNALSVAASPLGQRTERHGQMHTPFAPVEAGTDAQSFLLPVNAIRKRVLYDSGLLRMA
jgi:hypothetical protein